MAGDLEGKVAVITGAANGIGRATAELFVRHGARVLAADRDVERGQELADRLGDAVRFHAVDVGKPDEVRAMVDASVDAFGRIDVMFNNAGISCAPFADFLDDTFENFHDVIAVNLLGAMVGTQQAARHMKRQGEGGAILTNASIAGMLAGQGMMTYRASKAALVQFRKSAAIDLGKHNIRVNCIVPGHIRTELSSFSEKGAEDAAAQRLEKAVDAVYLSNQLLKRRGDPEDAAEVALFLASDKAKYVTGIAMPVDGGVTAGDPVNHLSDIIAARTNALKGG